MLNEVMPYSIKYDNELINGSMFLFNAQSNEKKLPYMLFVPEDMKDNSSLVVGNFTTGNSNMNYNDTISALIDIVKKGQNIEALLKKLCYELKCPILFPIIPRFNGFYSTFLTSDVYKNVFDRLDMHKKNGRVHIDESDKDYLRDIPKQVYDMINNSKNFINNSLKGQVQDKVIMTGYSAAGHFANAFSVLHTDVVSMVIAGGTDGILTLPYKKYNGQSLPVPIGVGDVDNFSIEEFKKIKYFVYMGLRDIGDCALLNKNKEAVSRECFSDEQARIINQMFGNCSTQERLEKVVDIYKYMGINIDMRTYNTDHFGIVSSNIATLVADDVYDFVSRNMEYGSKKL